MSDNWKLGDTLDERRSPDAANRRRVLRDVVKGELRKGNFRLALAILLWPPGWSHTRLEGDRGR